MSQEKISFKNMFCSLRRKISRHLKTSSLNNEGRTALLKENLKAKRKSRRTFKYDLLDAIEEEPEEISYGWVELTKNPIEKEMDENEWVFVSDSLE